MRKFWSVLAVQLGKRAGIVALAGLVLTVALGFGLTRLEFATGQDSYLNSDEQIAKDNVDYQSLFGGQIMLVLFTLDEGTSLADLVTGENRETFLEVTEELCGEMRDDSCTALPTVKSVVSPLIALELADNLIRRDNADPTQLAALPTNSIAGMALNDAIAKEEPGSAEFLARAKDQDRTACRLLGIDSPISQTPEDEREPCEGEEGFASAPGELTLDPEKANLDNPEWVDFLLHGNDGDIRRSLQATFPDERHALMIVRLSGWAGSIRISQSSATPVSRQSAGMLAMK